MSSPLKSAPLSRQLSLGSVVGWIVHEGPVSRAAIAKGTGYRNRRGTGPSRRRKADARSARGCRRDRLSPVGDDPFDPATREHGSLEAAVGAAGILRRFEAAGGSPAVASVRDIFDAVGRGDPIARTTVIETARLLALAVMSVSTLIEPELVVLGGSIGVRPELVGAVRDILPSCMAEPARVEASMLSSRAGIVGPLAVAINDVHNNLFGPAILPKALALPALPGLRGLELAA